MADNKAPKLQLSKRIDSAQMKQNVRGRSNTVTVEVKRTRTYSRGADGKLIADKQEAPTSHGASQVQAGNDQFAGLTAGEREARLKALARAENNEGGVSLPDLPPAPERFKKRETEVRETEPSNKAAPAQSSQQERRPREEQPNRGFRPGTVVRPSTRVGTARPSMFEEKAPLVSRPDEKEQPKKKEQRGRDDDNVAAVVQEDRRARQSEDKWSRTKLTVTNAMTLEDEDQRVRSLAATRRARQKRMRQQTQQQQDQVKQTREVTIPETISVQELANRMAVRGAEVVKELMKLGVMAAGTQMIDADTAELVVTELGHTAKRVTEADVEDVLKVDAAPTEDMEARPPVVTIMGHVDHGKTSLLDAIRSANVVDGEAGGITQHIGAYQVTTAGGEKITFLDTPGHAAFTAMRARGAKVTDIVVLLVAADDGVMPQTIEALNHAKAAEVPIIVAINKIDKPGANPRRVKEQLLEHELVGEEFGGDVQMVEVSAKARTNLDGLLESILLQAEVLELKASKKTRASGAVIEARLDKGRGVVATLLVQGGTLGMGDIVVAGTGFGKIKAMFDDQGKNITEGGPAKPVEILGLDELPGAGDEFAVVQNEKQAREVIEYRVKRQRDLHAIKHAKTTGAGGSVERMFQTAKSGQKEFRVVIKADVQGSVEAIVQALEKLSNEEVAVKVVHSGAGAITESDVTLAAAVGAQIFGFNVRAAGKTADFAEKEGIKLRYYAIIYDLLDDAKNVVTGLLAPIEREQYLGEANILQVFDLTKYGKVAGCRITKGMVKRGAGVRLIRDGVVIHQGKLKTLKRFKDDVQEVKEGFECGMAFENYDDMREGDTIEAYEVLLEARTL